MASGAVAVNCQFQNRTVFVDALRTLQAKIDAVGRGDGKIAGAEGKWAGIVTEPVAGLVNIGEEF